MWIAIIIIFIPLVLIGIVIRWHILYMICKENQKNNVQKRSLKQNINSKTRKTMKEELTTKMHAEFEISAEAEKRLSALSLMELEERGIPITDEDLEERSITPDQMINYRKHWRHLFAK